MTPERIAQIRGLLAYLPCREWGAGVVSVGDDPAHGRIVVWRSTTGVVEASITTSGGDSARRAVAAFFANSGRDIADLLAALEAEEARAIAAEAEAAQLRAVFYQDFLEDNEGARLAYERGVRDGREQVAEENAQAALADFDDDDGLVEYDDDDDGPAGGFPVPPEFADAIVEATAEGNVLGAGPPVAIHFPPPEGPTLHEAAPSTFFEDGVLDVRAYIEGVAAREMALPADVAAGQPSGYASTEATLRQWESSVGLRPVTQPDAPAFPPVTLATKSLTAKATGPTELLAGIKGPTVTATGQFPPPPEVPGGE
jgi:hypothetical protein